MNDILYASEFPRSFDVRWHSHDYWELVYCTGGKGTFHLESGVTINYCQNQAVAIPPREMHMNSSMEGFSNIHLQVDAPTFPYKSAFMVEDDGERHMGIAFDQARYYYQSDLKRRELVLSALGDLIASYMVVFRDNRDFSGTVEVIRASIIRNFADPGFQLDEEIRQMPFNYDYVRKLFHKEMGLTPLKYMTDLRMKKAKSMLATPQNVDLTVAEVAENCGYSDALYFSRVFKKYYGCAPSEFAKRQKEAGGLL